MKKTKKASKKKTLKLERNNNFDAVRMAAALMVLFFHCFHSLKQNTLDPIYATTGGLLSLGHVGLYIFFLLTIPPLFFILPL